MSRPAPRTLQVIASRYLTSNMLRVTLGGDEIATFPDDQEGAYIKLIFPGEEGAKDMTRTYTVRYQRRNQIDVDFVMHGDGGPASDWAKSARPGDDIRVGGPGPKKLVDNTADWFLLVGDMSALPAMSVCIEQLPADARGYAVIEVAEESDIQTLAHPPSFALHWVITPELDKDSRGLINRVRQLEWLSGRPSVWAACEFSKMRELRRYFKEDRHLERQELYISSYWKCGSSENQHKLIKRQDNEVYGE